MTKTLDVESRLKDARAGVAVIRALQLEGRTMPYAQFARAVGLLSGSQKWGAWYRTGQAKSYNSSQRPKNPPVLALAINSNTTASSMQERGVRAGVKRIKSDRPRQGSN
jgi:hypothetical protein